QAVEAGGAALLTVHARTKVEGYEPPAHWHWVARIREAVSLPVVANGDVFSLEDYLTIRRESGCDDVMLGRGAVMVPDLARQIARHNRGLPPAAADFAEEQAWMRQFFGLCRSKEENGKYAVARLKQWLGMMKKVRPQAGRLFERIRTVREADEVGRLLAEEI
ncbi:MAG: tRNA-dihydrouridine synthase, partial [Eikenella sp.]|nr:tRNA-dihydrouridine synthase [Eikenella sp.]